MGEILLFLGEFEERLILLGFEGILKVFLMILVWWEWRKTLIFQGFVELGIELKMGVEA